MATTKEFVDYIEGNIQKFGSINSKKMFGEYLTYINNKPILLVCNNTIYIKILDEIKDLMVNAQTDYPYHGAKLHYILDLEDESLINEVLPILERITPIPKSKKKITK